MFACRNFLDKGIRAKEGPGGGSVGYPVENVVARWTMDNNDAPDGDLRVNGLSNKVMLPDTFSNHIMGVSTKVVLPETFSNHIMGLSIKYFVDSVVANIS